MSLWCIVWFSFYWNYDSCYHTFQIICMLLLLRTSAMIQVVNQIISVKPIGISWVPHHNDLSQQYIIIITTWYMLEKNVMIIFQLKYGPCWLQISEFLGGSWDQPRDVCSILERVLYRFHIIMFTLWLNIIYVLIHYSLVMSSRDMEFSHQCFMWWFGTRLLHEYLMTCCQLDPPE